MRCGGRFGCGDDVFYMTWKREGSWIPPRPFSCGGCCWIGSHCFTERGKRLDRAAFCKKRWIDR